MLPSPLLPTPDTPARPMGSRPALPRTQAPSPHPPPHLACQGQLGVALLQAGVVLVQYRLELLVPPLSLGHQRLDRRGLRPCRLRLLPQLCRQHILRRGEVGAGCRGAGRLRHITTRISHPPPSRHEGS